MKETKLNNLMRRAEILAELSPDSETKVGCIAVREDGSILGEAYNGFIRGAPDHILPTTRPDKHRFIRHSEANLISFCAKHGISLNGAILICTLSPCIECARNLYMAGITQIYFKGKYRHFEDQLKYEDLEMFLTEVGEYYSIELRPRKGE